MTKYPFPHADVVKYHARQIRTFCKEHRCATCPFHVDDKCTFLKDSPCDWRGIENENND